MKLTAELVFDRLSERFDIRYVLSADRGAAAGRPVFYGEGGDAAGHVAILPSRGLPAEMPGGGVFVCVGAVPPDFSARDIELMSVPETVSLSALFNALQEIFDYYDAWEAEMTEIIETDKGYDELLQCGTKYLECPISLVDVDFTIIAFADNLGGDFRDDLDRNKVSPSIMSEMFSDPLFAKGLYISDVFEHNIGGGLFFSYNFKRDGKYLGRVTLYYKSGLSEEACRYLFRILAQKIEVALRKFGSFLMHKETLSSLREILLGCLKNAPRQAVYGVPPQRERLVV